MQHTVFRLQKRVVCPALSLLLLVALLFQSVFPLPATDCPVWDETLVTCSRRRGSRRWRRYWQARLACVSRRGPVLLCRLVLVSALLLWSGWSQRKPWCWGLLSVPVIDAGLPLLLLEWPRLARRKSYLYLLRGMHQVYQSVLIFLFCEALFPRSGHAFSLTLIGGTVRLADGAEARGRIEEDGSWHLEMTGSFNFRFKPQNEFEERALLVFLRQIRTPRSTPRRPFLRQTWLAGWFDTRQELISRWEGYVRQGGLLKLRGEPEGRVLTPQLRTAILDIWIPAFWLSAAQVLERLVAGGHIASPDELPEENIYRAARESGFAEVRRQLRRMFHFTAEGPRWRDGVLIERLFELNETLLARLEAGKGLIPRLTLEAQSLKQALGTPVTLLRKPLPCAYRLQQALFGQWEEIEDSPVRCPHCGSNRVARKENKPRRKKYRDPQTGAWKETEGFRYYCHNPVCSSGSFTDYPEGVRLHSRWTVETMIWGVMVYMQMRTTYRRAAEAVGVPHVTLWRWALLVGQQALPVAVLFGVVRSSGVVAVDEKWVLVPKNDKPAGKRRRWMYVYLAVDVYTYDLLHIDIHAYNGKKQASAFLQALKAKGYRPQVIVTDMNQDYADPIRTVFPDATHHECIFHALQRAQRLVKEVYGNDYASTHPEAVDLKERIYRIFKARSRKTVNKRYRKVLAMKDRHVARTPDAHRIFDFLERHYPRLVNAVENPLIPLTNNTVELVIRRFDQHYQNMCGFDSIETARNYLHLFELTYRFTPFVEDNRPVKGRKLDIRGKCPLELAGYDISQMPITHILRGRLLGLPPETIRELVPGV